MKRDNLVGQRFKRLLVERQARRSPGAQGSSHWLCLCDCGTEVIVKGGKLKSGEVGSCGCLRRTWAITHKMTHHPVYKIYRAMRTRCENPNQPGWLNYGGRGISVCERWMIFENFLKDMGHPVPGESLDRINVNGNYEPGNCRWADAKTQSFNKRNTKRVAFNGETLTLEEWGARIGISYRTLYLRLRNGWSIEKALTSPHRGWPKSHHNGISE